METPKAQSIKAAYGEYWGKLSEEAKDFVLSNDGYVSYWHWSHFNMDFDFDLKTGGLYRPKSLSGIETNNGWISISLENIILPIDGTEVHFYVSFANENGIQREHHKGIFNAALGFTSYYDSERYNIKEVTHYQPIETPKPPIF
ncbi:hypothetical protein HZP50_07070 [Elizabethkingia anophelis]|nr:hypothetical protein [Elizabethkingia anophelis]